MLRPVLALVASTLSGSRDGAISALTDLDSKLLSQLFPRVKFAFSYGSGVIEQSGYDKCMYESSKTVRALSASASASTSASASAFAGRGGADELLPLFYAI